MKTSQPLGPCAAPLFFFSPLPLLPASFNPHALGGTPTLLPNGKVLISGRFGIGGYLVAIASA